MKIIPILAALVVLSSLAYAEKPSPPPREAKTPPRNNSGKPPVRPVKPKPSADAAPFNPKELGTTANTPRRPNQTPPAQGAARNATSPANPPRVVVVTGEEDNAVAAGTANTGTQARSSKNSPLASPGKPRGLVSGNDEGGVDEDIETNGEESTSGSSPTTPAGGPAKRRSRTSPPLASKWELAELDAAKAAPKPAAAAQQTPPTASPSAKPAR
ncbi:MAG TPA: hypothetical protein VHO24_05165 [Opitutaceae bacterium]|nr:hypothetical protein [Opitutaceae bacterium]